MVPGRNAGRVRATCGAHGRSTARRRPSSTSTARTSRRAATSSRPIRGRSSTTRTARARRRAACSTGWTSRARGIRLARTAAAEDSAPGPGGRLLHLRRGRSRSAAPARPALLARIFEDEPPDLILLETLSLIREPDTFDLVSSLRRARPSPLALVSALPARRLRRLRPALGAARGRPLRPRGDAIRGDGRRRAADQLPPRRPRPRDDELAARLHRHAARRLPEPRPPDARAVALRRPHRPGGVRASSRSSGATRARRSSAAAAASRRSTSPPPQPPWTERRAGHRRVAPRPDTVDGSSPAAVDALARRGGTHDLPAPVSRSRRRAGRLRSDPGELPALEAPPTHGPRSGRHVPRRRLRLRDPRRAARAQRRRRGARDRHRPRLGREHARQRVPQRRRGARHRRDDRPLPVGADGALRRDRREPLPDARRSLRGAERAPAARLLGPQPVRPLPRAPARPPRSRRAGARPAALDPRPGEDGPAARRPRPRRRAWSTTASSPSARSSRPTRSRSRGSRSSRTPTTSRSAATT